MLKRKRFWAPDLRYRGAAFYFDFLQSANPLRGGGTTTTTIDADGWYFNSSSLLIQKTTNVWPLEYDYITGQPLGRPVFEGRDNRCLQVRNKSNAAWTKSNITVSAATDLSGNSSNIRLTATAGNGTCLQAITSASVARTYSTYIKRVSGTGNISITLDNGATWTDVTSSIVSGAFRIVSATQTLANPTVGVRITTSGDVIDVDLDQEETGSFATRPIVTAGSTVTRAADACSIALAGLPFNATEGTFVVEYIAGSPVANTTNQQVVNFGDGTTGNRFNVLRRAVDGIPRFEVTTASVLEVAISGGSSAIQPNAITRQAATYKLNDYATSANGATAATDTSGAVPTVTTIGLGQLQTLGIQQLNGWLRKLYYYPPRYDNSRLQSFSQ